MPVTYFLLGVGLLFLVDGTIGWAAVSKRNRVLLKLFLILTFFIFISEVGLILTLSIFKTNSTQVTDQIWHEMNVKSQVLVQEHLQCCGLNGPSDYESSRDFDASCYHREFPSLDSSPSVGSSLVDTFSFASRPTSSNADFNSNGLLASKSIMNSDGCRQKIVDFSHDNRIFILAASASLLVFQMITMLLTSSAISLTRRRSHMDSLEELDRSSGGSGMHQHAHSVGYQGHSPSYM